jgi:hypothetical protein
MQNRKGERQRELESPEYLGEEGGAAGGGSSGGNLARNVGTKDEMKRSTERPAGTTGVQKSDKGQITNRQ